MREKENKHIIDILFVLALFGIFVLSAVFLISIGANIYSATVKSMDNNFNSRTAVAYILEKVHQSDEEGSITVGDFEEYPSLIISSYSNDKEYITYIYECEGALRELTVRSNVSLSPKAGQKILDVDSFNISMGSDNLISCSIRVNHDEDYDFNIALHTKGDSDE